MQTIEALRGKIHSAEDLLSVVKTMKTLAAVNIRHYELAVESLGEYSRTVEMGLHIVLTAESHRGVTARPAKYDRLGVVLFGSDQGLCGQFNERIVAHTLESLADQPEPMRQRFLLSVGGRCAALCDESGQSVETILATPGGIAGIAPLVQELLIYIERWRRHDDIDRILIFYNRPQGNTGYIQTSVQLLPVDLEWLHSLEQARWPSRMLPTFTMNWDQLFAALIRQYMYVALFRASAESLAAENAARVASMQNAERNIEDRLEELQRSYHRQRQNQITAELLDIVSGFEAVMGTQVS
jgi:F-type H+-transporting ATPase subunit gamma